MEKLKSRKFWMAVGAEIIALTTGLGLNVNPSLVMAVCGAIPVIYIAIEGIIDAIAAKNGGWL